MAVALSTRRRRLARNLAAQCLLECEHEDQLQPCLEQKLQSYGLDPATAIAIIYYAIKLWLWWRDRKIQDPGLDPISGEPEE
jgi:hypothetical protein